MRAAVYYANDDVRVEEMPLPRIGPGELLVKVIASGICGSDVMEWYRLGKAPLVLGHEIAGEVAAVGDGVGSWSAGDRVVVSHHVPCNTCRYCHAGRHTLCRTLRTTNFDPGGFAEYVRVPAINLESGGVLRLPESLSFEEATFVEPLGCVVRSFETAGFRRGGSTLVLGSGISGLLHVKLGKALGCSRLIAADVNEWRLEAATRFGADVAVDARENVSVAVQEANEDRGADYVFVCTAAPPALETAVGSVEEGGTIVLFAPYEPGTRFSMPIDELWRRQVTIVSTYAAAPEDLVSALELIGSGRVGVGDMITHRLGLEQTAWGFELVARAQESLKVIVEPHR
ncbi:MAG: alcohol dehydrogenase [Actinobacteria bacterium]|nr:MAG: alcohol dehydrogenase [Actinomycetota bacterium]